MLSAFRVAAGIAAGVVGSLAFESVALADLVSPPGSCVGTASFPSAEGFPAATYSSQSLLPGTVVTLPQKDSFSWSGADHAYSGAKRAISGYVSVKVGGLFSVNLWSWGGSSSRVANSGEDHYDATSLVKGIEAQVTGAHYDGGTLTCSGSATVKFGGSSPLVPASAGGIALGAAGLAFAARRKP